MLLSTAVHADGECITVLQCVICASADLVLGGSDL